MTYYGIALEGVVRRNDEEDECWQVDIRYELASLQQPNSTTQAGVYTMRVGAVPVAVIQWLLVERSLAFLPSPSVRVDLFRPGVSITRTFVVPEEQRVVENEISEPNTPASSHVEAAQGPPRGWDRVRQALPGRKRDRELDRTILTTAIPSMINLAVVPIVNSVDTFWVGRMGVALALAGQAAANQAFFTIFFLVNYLPTITAPLVAAAVGSGDEEAAKKRVCEALFLCTVLGGIGTVALVSFPVWGANLVLQEGAPALSYATPYLRFRVFSLIPALVSATGFAAFRGMLDTVTPLKVSLGTNLLNLVLDPLLIFATPLGFLGASIATAISEAAGGLVYLRLLIRKGLASVREIVRPPPLSSLIPLLQGGLTMLGRQLAINVGILSAARRAQCLDPTGVSGAAYGIVMQMYSIGIVMHVALQGTAAALVPSTLAKSGPDEARRVSDRMFSWSLIVGCLLGVTQMLALPSIVPLFSTIPEVQQAVYLPGLLISILHVINSPVFWGEGVMLGLSKLKELMLITACNICVMVGCLSSPLGQRLDGILLSILAWSTSQAISVVVYYLRFSPLANPSKTSRVSP